MGPGLLEGWGSLPLLGFCAALAALPACASAAPPPVLPPRPVQAPPPVVVPPPAAPPPVVAAPAEPPPPEDADADDAYAEEDVPDDEDATAAPAPPPAPAPSPLLQLSDAEIRARFRNDSASFGPLSVGRPNAGALVNGVRMPSDSAKWIVLEPGLAWGTQETVDGISRAIERVHADFPGSPPIPIGHISSKSGGHLSPHKSHQAGRDVDIGYYFTTPKTQFISGTKANLDLPRTFALVKAFFAVSAVEMIFIDTSIQKLLVEYGVSHGEDVAWIDRTFQVRQKPGFAPIRHVRGHRNHLHVRFASPQAVALGNRVAGMVAIRSAPPPGQKGGPAVAAAAPGEKLASHKARSGDTLQILARRYGTTVEAIQRANGIKGTALKAGHVYQIPVPAPARAGSPLPASAKHPTKVAHKPSPGKAAPQRQSSPPKPEKKGKAGG